MQYTNRHLATKKIHMIAFRLILLRIKFTTCATCHAFYLKRYQTSCSFCVYIVSTHHATILIASLILQIPHLPINLNTNAAKFSYFTQFSPPCLSHPPNSPPPHQSQHKLRQILLLHPILPSLPLSSSKSPPPHQSQHNAAKLSYFTQFSPPCLSHPPNPRLPNNLNTTPPNSPNSPPYAPNSLPHSAQIPL